MTEDAREWKKNRVGTGALACPAVAIFAAAMAEKEKSVTGNARKENGPKTTTA